MSIFGNNIKTLRNSLNLSQQEFGDLFSLSRGSIGSYEEGRADPKIESLVKISNHFNLPIDDLLKKKLNPKGVFESEQISNEEQPPNFEIATSKKIFIEERVENLESEIEKIKELLKNIINE